jgi:hypothetical protein
MKVADFSKLLENKVVLYLVLFLAVSAFLGYMMAGNAHALFFFIIIGIITTFFSKNMVVILGTPLIITSIFMVGKSVKEGLENKDDKKKPTEDKKSSQELVGAQGEHENHNNTSKSDSVNKDKDTGSNAETNNQSSEPIKSEEFSNFKKKKHNIDYASTIEDAYGNLDKILGSDGIKNLTNDTQKLMGQQLQLAEAMKSMSPLLDQAKGLLQGFDMKNFDGLASIAKSFSPAPVHN